MATRSKDDEVIDSPIISENISFLNDCFDKSFAVQSSLSTLKEYISQEQNDVYTKTNSFKKSELSVSNNSIIKKERENLSKSWTTSFPNKICVSKHLHDWGLPFEISNNYAKCGIITMFDWQVNCLGNPKVLLDGCNLVYSAPTSAGKTLVAEILAIKTILELQKKVIIILPFVSIVREKMFYLQSILSSSGIRVEGFMGSQSPPGGLNSVHVAICTIEKANSLINRLLDDNTISELGSVIVDELHLLGDPHRGYILELLLTKVKYVSEHRDDVKIQIIGMSATLPNLDILANWLGAELFVTQFRPIPLDEYCLVGNKYFNKNGITVDNIDGAMLTDNENDNLLNICLETIKGSCSILIFCMTKNRCENLAQTIAAQFFNIGCSNKPFGSILRQQLKSENISEVLEQLKNSPVGLDQVLKNAISFGVAYHHAGLTFDERDIIEGGFKSGAIRVLVATSTLSSGVNLPARKVIVRTPMFQRKPINILTYKQMIGRAGRMGKDSRGESILICTEAEKKIGFDLMMGALEPVKSCIDSEDKFMRAVLEIIASHMASTKDELDLYSKCTLLYSQKNELHKHSELLENTLQELVNFELVRIQLVCEQKCYVATSLGKACLSSSLPPHDGISLFCELQKARQCLVLETNLHLIYLVTPYSVSSQWGDIDWLHLLTLWESLTNAMKKVGELVGVQESFIIRCLRGTSKLSNVQNKLNVHKRFYTALALQDLVNEVPLSDVATKFQCNRGFLQSLQQSAATFAGMVTSFCHQLGWKNMEMLVSQFQDRLHFGIHSELLELMKLPSLNGKRARTLFDAGYETISSIASSDPNGIENALLKSIPFESDRERDGDDIGDLKKRNKLKSIWITGCCGMTAKEAAEKLIHEARKCIEYEIGVPDIKWTQKSYESKVKFNTTSSGVGHLAVKDISLKNSGVSILADQLKPTVPFENLTSQKHKVNNSILRDIEQHCIKDEHNINHLESEHTSNVKTIQSSVQFEHKEEIFENKNPSDSYPEDDIVWESLNFTNQSMSTIHVKNSKLISQKKLLNKTSKKEFKSYSAEEKCNIHIKHTEKYVNYEQSMKSSLLLDHERLLTDEKVSSLKSDDVEWDSLTFTDITNENMSEIPKSPSNHSRNINLTEDNLKLLPKGDKISLHSKSLIKDITLFSSDGDDSSLFEESLPVDQITSKILDVNKTDHISSKLLHVSNEAIVKDTNVNSPRTTNLETASIETEEDENIHLVYEDELINEVENDLNITNDINLMNSLDFLNTLTTSPLKRSDALTFNNKDEVPIAKKRKIEDKTTKLFLENDSKMDRKNLSTPSFTCKIASIKVNCYILNQKDVYYYWPIIENAQNVALHVNNSKNKKSGEIGTNILKHEANAASDTNNQLIDGVSIYLENNNCFYLDISSLNEMFQIVSKIAQWLKRKSVKLKLMSLKSCELNLKKQFSIGLPVNAYDVSLAEWLIDSCEKIHDIIYLVQKYCHFEIQPNTLININNKKKTLKTLDKIEDACLKSCLIWQVAMNQEKQLLEKYQIMRSTIGTEVYVSKILAGCEYYGLTVDRQLASQLLIDVKNSQEILQKKAYKICGYHFNFNSSRSVAKVLGMYKGRKVSTKKSVLTAHNSVMSSIVIYWRKLNSILTKTLYPLTEQACIYSSGSRINPTYTMLTCTGRISMHEPNLQNVPRTFSIPMKYLTSGDKMDKPCDDVMEFNCRNVFKAAPGYVLVSADYCQLEMRILTHFSEDRVLMAIMRSGLDVFTSIAASWGGVTEEQVDDDLRQRAKQLCYGILYGMGNKTLSQCLDVSEMEAAVFMDSFHRTYPAVKTFTQSLIKQCRVTGYVETLSKRRRYLPDINSNIMSKRSTAERQAVNTTIQGSAADIAKEAMCAIDMKTEGDNKPQLILQMHDELIYEVPETFKQDFITIIKQVMENTVSLRVPLPVKVKSGYSWGSLKEIFF